MYDRKISIDKRKRKSKIPSNTLETKRKKKECKMRFTADMQNDKYK